LTKKLPLDDMDVAIGPLSVFGNFLEDVENSDDSTLGSSEYQRSRTLNGIFVPKVKDVGIVPLATPAIEVPEQILS